MNDSQQTVIMAENQEKSSWVEVYRAFDGTKIAFVESLLNSEDIPLQVSGELVNRVFGGALAPVDGVSILVPMSYEERAMSLLRSAGYLPDRDSSADAVILRGNRKKPLRMNRLIWGVITIIVVILALMAMFAY